MRKKPELPMSDWEIAAHYRQAKYPGEDIKILSQLCAVNQREIVAALRREGVEVLPKTRRMPEDGAAMELYSQGLWDEEIARRLGVYAGSVTNWRKKKGLPRNYQRGDPGKKERSPGNEGPGSVPDGE